MNATFHDGIFSGRWARPLSPPGGLSNLVASELTQDNICLGMMLQGDSVADLQEKAKRIAAAGFQRVQTTFSSTRLPMS